MDKQENAVMKRAVFVSLYLLLLAISGTLFAEFVNADRLGALPRVIIVILAIVLLAFGVYLAHRVTRQHIPKRS